MIRRTKSRTPNSVKVSFALSLDVAPNPVSVVGDFNDWDATAHPLRKRSNGTRSVTVELAEGESVQFKYLGENGDWFPEHEADGAVVNEWGEVNSRLDL